MALYYFNLRNDVSVDDPEGYDFPTLEAARQFGCDQARDMVAVCVKEEGTLDLSHHVDVVDESGVVRARILFAEIVKVSIAGRPVA